MQCKPLVRLKNRKTRFKSSPTTQNKTLRETPVQFWNHILLTDKPISIYICISEYKKKEGTTRDLKHTASSHGVGMHGC